MLTTLVALTADRGAPPVVCRKRRMSGDAAVPLHGGPVTLPLQGFTRGTHCGTFEFDAQRRQTERLPVTSHDPAFDSSASIAGSSLVWPLGLVGMTVAALVNVGLYETAVAAGESFRLRSPDVFETFQALTTGFREVAVTNVLINTVVPFVIGLALFRFALQRSWTSALALLALGVAFAIVTTLVPLSLDRPPAHPRELLARMHLVTGALFAVSVLPALIIDARRARSLVGIPSIPAST